MRTSHGIAREFLLQSAEVHDSIFLIIL
jgi:hypothetical protein